jgi:hypothetical protein
MERAPHTHCIGRWVGPSTDLNDVQQRIFLTLPGPELGPLVAQLPASFYTDRPISTSNSECTASNEQKAEKSELER